MCLWLGWCRNRLVREGLSGRDAIRSRGKQDRATRHKRHTSSLAHWPRAAELPADIASNLAATAGLPHRPRLNRSTMTSTTMITATAAVTVTPIITAPASRPERGVGGPLPSGPRQPAGPMPTSAMTMVATKTSGQNQRSP